MFKSEKEELNVKDAETIIGPSIKVKGNFHGQGNIIIEGIVEGNVKTSKFLLVSSKAKISASIEAKDARVGGEIVGNLKVKGFLQIDSSARVFGDIECMEISVEKGAILNGKCSMMAKEKPIQENKQ